MVEARVGCAARASFLWHKPNSVPAFARWRSFISLGSPSAQLLEPGATITRGILPAFAGKAGRLPFPSALSCTTWGFSYGSACATPGGLLPRLFTLTPHHFRPSQGCGRFLDLKVVLGGIFSVTLSVTRDLHPGCPRFLEACCLTVFGLSSGKTSVKPATTHHG